jgi:hypothetical protein
MEDLYFPGSTFCFSRKSRSSKDTGSLRLRGAAGTGGRTGLEAVLEPAGDVLEVPHAAGTGGLPPLRLLGPVVCFCGTPSQHIVSPSRNRTKAWAPPLEDSWGREEGGMRLFFCAGLLD